MIMKKLSKKKKEQLKKAGIVGAGLLGLYLLFKGLSRVFGEPETDIISY